MNRRRLKMFKYRIGWTNRIDFHLKEKVSKHCKIKKVWLHASVSEIGFLPFEGFDNLEWIEVDERNTALSACDGILYNKEKSIIYYAAVKSPEWIISKEITHIGSNAFSNCLSKIRFESGSKLIKIGEYAFYRYAGSRVIVPKGVNIIERCAFRSSSAIVDYEDGSQLIEIGEYAFSDYGGLSVSIPKSVVRIGDCAFEKCSFVSEIEIPRNVNKIGKRAFAYTKSKIIFEEGSLLEKIESNTFESYTGTKITIPSSVRIIGDYAFSNASNLTSLVIPNGVISIGDYAFFYSTKLSNITIPNSVKKIGKYAFAGCNATITFEEGSQLEEIDINTFTEYKGFRASLPIDAKNKIRVNSENKASSEPIKLGDKGFYLKLSGVTYNNRQKNIQQIKVGEELQYVRESDNSFDKNAIMIKTKSGLEIGYIPKQYNVRLAQNMDKGLIYKIVVSNITGTDNQNKGVNIFVSDKDKSRILSSPVKIDVSHRHRSEFDDYFEPLFDNDFDSMNDGDSAWDPLDDVDDFDNDNW